MMWTEEQVALEEALGRPPRNALRRKINRISITVIRTLPHTDPTLLYYFSTIGVSTQKYPRLGTPTLSSSQILTAFSGVLPSES